MAERPDIFREIEATAGYHQPSDYLSLLTRYNDYEDQGDVLGNEFIPVSTVAQRGLGHSGARAGAGRNPKLFAIGVIPPGIRVTGRRLDRSASVDVTGIDDSGITPRPPPQPTAAGGPVKPVGSAALHRKARPIIIEAFKELFGREPTLAELQYVSAIGYLETKYGTSWTKKSGGQGSNNWGAVQCGVVAKASGAKCFDSTDSFPSGRRYDVGFVAYDSPKDGAAGLIKHTFTHTAAAKGLREGGTIMCASWIMRYHSYYGGFCKKSIKAGKVSQRNADRSAARKADTNEQTKICAKEAITDHAKLVQGIMAGVAQAHGEKTTPLGSFEHADECGRKILGIDENGNKIEGDGSRDGNFKKNGAKNAQDWSKQLDKVRIDDDLLGRFNAAQDVQSLETDFALDLMKSTPPLRMLVNPRSFGVKGVKIVQDGNWSRTGPVVEHWGDAQDTISASGRVAGFYAVDRKNANGPGLTRSARNYSLAWQNFMSLYLLYRNNGGMYLTDYIDRFNDARNLHLVGSIYIFYDNILYVGSFNSFNITEDETKPFGVEYNFEFVVRAAFLLDRTDDEFTYGAPSLFPKKSISPTASQSVQTSTAGAAPPPVTAPPPVGTAAPVQGEPGGPVGLDPR